MNAHDDSMFDSVAVLALGALPRADAALVTAHVLACADCRAEYDDVRAAADLVARSAEIAPGDLDEVTAARMKSRVMRVVRAERPASNGSTPVTALPTVASTAGTRTSPTWLPYGVAAAAVLLAFFSSLDDRTLRSQSATQAQSIAELRERNDRLASGLALLSAPGGKRFAIARGEVVESGGRIVIALSGFPSAPSGKVYQAWTLARGSKTVAPSITFTPDASGRAVVVLPESAAGLAAIAVSVEPTGGSRTPTSKATFVRALS